MNRKYWLLIAVLPAALFLLLPREAMRDDALLSLNLRSRVKAPGQGTFTMTEKRTAWEPKKTALIICDMWDDHWCKSAARRVGELAGPMNEVVRIARSR